MSRIFGVACALVCGAFMRTSAVAAVEPGENVLFNPTLVKDQSELPQGWVVPSNADAPHVIADYAPGGQTAFVFRDADLPGGTSVRQKDIGLVPGGRYRLGFKAKTVGFRGGTALCVVADAKWKADAGVREFPENSDWADYTAEFACMPRVRRSDGADRYQFIISIDKGFSGEIAFSYLKLEAIDGQSRAGTEKMRLPEAVTRPRIIPLSPLLHRIDREDPQVTIAFRNFDAKAKRLMISMTANGEKEERPFTEEQVFRLDRVPDCGAFDIAVIEAESGRVVSQRSFSYAKVRRPPVAGSAPRRLNNFVSELPVVESSEYGKRIFSFALAKPGWVYVNDGGRESARRYESGMHRLAASSDDSVRPVVRAIGEIYYYSPLTDNKVDCQPKRTWERFSKEVLPNITTVDGAKLLTDEQAAYMQAEGRHVEAIFVSREFKTREEFDRALRTDRAMTLPRYDGAVLDEQFFDRQTHLDLCTEALWKFSRECPDERHRVAAAIVGNPMNGALDTDFLSAVANASQGRGVLNVEAYYRTKATEAEAYAEIRRAYGKTVAAMKAACPLAADHMLLMLGIFTQYPILSLVHHPEVDYRYYLDMQMQAAATDPVFAGLCGVGVWGSGYADEELHDWTVKLLRHYFIEGNTTLLSERYGLKYIPGLIQNGDFRGGLSGWETSGGVAADRIVKLGRDVLGRWWAPGSLGDEFAAFTRGKEPGRARQMLKGLEPGRRYQLEFLTFDPREVRAKTPGSRRHPLRGTLGSGAKVDAARSWVWTDGSFRGKIGTRTGFVNLHHLVFTAESSEVEFCMDDAEASEGEVTGVNSVSVKLALAEGS